MTLPRRQPGAPRPHMFMRRGRRVHVPHSAEKEDDERLRVGGPCAPGQTPVLQHRTQVVSGQALTNVLPQMRSAILRESRLSAPRRARNAVGLALCGEMPADARERLAPIWPSAGLIKLAAGADTSVRHGWRMFPEDSRRTSAPASGSRLSKRSADFEELVPVSQNDEALTACTLGPPQRPVAWRKRDRTCRDSKSDALIVADASAVRPRI